MNSKTIIASAAVVFTFRPAKMLGELLKKRRVKSTGALLLGTVLALSSGCASRHIVEAPTG